MLKENDLVAYGEDEVSRVQAAVASLEPNEDHAFIEIETTSAKQALTAALAWCQHRTSMGDTPLVIMLDNLGPETCKDVAAEMESLGVREHVVLEASGGITFEGLSDWKESGMDVISTSAVSRGVAPLDLTMLMDGVWGPSREPDRRRPKSPKVCFLASSAPHRRGGFGRLAGRKRDDRSRPRRGLRLPPWQRTTASAAKATREAYARLHAAKHPVISVNGNTVALAGRDLLHLAASLSCPLEVNIFYRTQARMDGLISRLEAWCDEDGLEWRCSAVEPTGASPGWKALERSAMLQASLPRTVVLVPLEDGDRCEALVAMGKTVLGGSQPSVLHGTDRFGHDC